MLKAIKGLVATIATASLMTQAAIADDVKDFLNDFDFNTGRVLIVAPEGVHPSSDWFIKFVADIGGRKANSSPIVIDYANQSTDKVALPKIVSSSDNAIMLNVTPSLSVEAAQTRTDFVSLKQMDVDDQLDISMQLAASFRIDEAKKASVCAAQETPAPVDVWIKSSDDAEWQRLSDMENLWKFGFFLRSAINSACPTI